MIHANPRPDHDGPDHDGPDLAMLLWASLEELFPGAVSFDAGAGSHSASVSYGDSGGPAVRVDLTAESASVPLRGGWSVTVTVYTGRGRTRTAAQSCEATVHSPTELRAFLASRARPAIGNLPELQR